MANDNQKLSEPDQNHKLFGGPIKSKNHDHAVLLFFLLAFTLIIAWFLMDSALTSVPPSCGQGIGGVGCLGLPIIFVLVEGILQPILWPISHFVMSSYALWHASNIWVFLTGALIIKYLLILLLALIPFLLFFYILKRLVPNEAKAIWKKISVVVYLSIVLLFSLSLTLHVQDWQNSTLQAKRIDQMCRGDGSCVSAFLKSVVILPDRFDAGYYFPNLYTNADGVSQYLSSYTKDELSRFCANYDTNKITHQENILYCELKLNLIKYSDLSDADCALVSAAYPSVELRDRCTYKNSYFKSIDITKLNDKNFILNKPILWPLGTSKNGEETLFLDQVNHINFTLYQMSKEDVNPELVSLLDSKFIWPSFTLISKQNILVANTPTVFEDGMPDGMGNEPFHKYKISFIFNDSFFSLYGYNNSVVYTPEIENAQQIFTALAEKIINLDSSQ